jgi:succinyl-diaminopimelate desuccinylase
MNDRIVDLLRMLVAFRTVEGNQASKQECIDYIASGFLSRAGRRIERGIVKGCPYALMPCEGAQLIWFAHLDVVPGSEQQFVLDVRGDKLFGRGAKDMKGAVVPFLLAFADACDAGTIPRVTVLLTTDEEIGGPTIPQLLERGAFTEPAAFTPDSGSDPWMIIEHKAIAQARLIARGKGGHGATPWKTNNPIPLLARAILAIDQAFPHGTHADWQMTVTPTMLHGATAWNVIPNEVMCAMDIRITPEQARDPEAALDPLRAVLPEGCTLTLERFASPLRTPKDHPMVLRMQRIAQDVLGHPISLGRVHGGTDARHFGQAGIPAFLYGPEGAGLHGPEEWVSLPSLRQHVEINARLLAELCD